MNAYPTLYKGFRFRSRHEARCAAFFDLVEWPWEYEPFDLEGYIPDFLLKLPHGCVLLEVKPQDGADIGLAKAKIDGSTWGGEALIFTGLTRNRIGYLREFMPDGTAAWDDCLLFRCPDCKRISFNHASASFHCRVNGCYDGCSHAGEGDAHALWAQAANITQWHPDL